MLCSETMSKIITMQADGVSPFDLLVIVVWLLITRHR